MGLQVPVSRQLSKMAIQTLCLRSVEIKQTLIFRSIGFVSRSLKMDKIQKSSSREHLFLLQLSWVTLLYAEDPLVFEKLLIFHSKEISERCQIFCIRQKNSYSRLYLSQEAFEQLLLAYSIFSRIWDFALQFNSKTRESDIGHAPFRFRQLDPVLLDGCLGSYGIVSH